MTEKEMPPILHNVKFIHLMDAFLRECKVYDDPIKDLEEFWKEYKYEVYEAYRDASYWRDFQEIIELAQENS